MKVIHSAHVSVMHRHMQDGTDIEKFDEGTLTFVGPATDLRRIRGVKANDRAIVIDPIRRTADHGTHTDPAIIVEDSTLTFLQIFLCGSGAGEEIKKVAVVMDDNSIMMLDPVRHEAEDDEPIHSELKRVNGGWQFEVHGGSITPIWQHARFGIERESVGMPIVGSGNLRIPPLFADRLGLCLTTDDMFGGVEHKHLLHGEAGQASGRWVYVGGNMHAPKAKRMPAYRSVVARLMDGDVPPPDAFAGFDELQIFCRPEHADLAMRDYAASGIHALSVMTVSEEEQDDPDILLVDPRLGYHGRLERPISTLLFCDQNDPSYPDRFQAAVSLFRHLPEETPVLESAWFSESGVDPERGVRHYGISYSYSTADFPKAMVELTRRLTLPDRQLCGNCQHSSTCLDMLATPWAKTVQPSQSLCRIKDGLELLYRD